MQPHQQRVVDEKTELDAKLCALILFLESSPIFTKLEADEQHRLVNQAFVMGQYSVILRERIARFK